jgi:hypothetical protein
MFESLVEQLGVLLFPPGHRGVERAQDILDLLAAGDGEAAAVLLIKLKHLLGANVHPGHLLAGVYPKLLALDRCQPRTGRARPFYPFRVAYVAHKIER